MKSNSGKSLNSGKFLTNQKSSMLHQDNKEQGRSNKLQPRRDKGNKKTNVVWYPGPNCRRKTLRKPE